MSELTTIQQSTTPLTAAILRDALSGAGLESNGAVLVHCSMSRLGWIVGGAQTVVSTLLDVIADGTVMMPAFTTSNSDPADWSDPPVPQTWWSVIREHQPAYDPVLSPTRQMGQVAEMFRSLPGAVRSSHPTMSFAALGPKAHELIAGQTLEDGLGERSPLARLYDMDGQVLLLGVGHGNNTSLHLAEHRAAYPGKRRLTTGSALQIDGVRQWVSYETLAFHDADFERIGEAFEAERPSVVHTLGAGEFRLFRQRELVDFAQRWIEQHRDLTRVLMP